MLKDIPQCIILELLGIFNQFQNYIVEMLLTRPTIVHM